MHRACFPQSLRAGVRAGLHIHSEVMTNHTKLFLALTALFTSSTAFACASCGCTLSSDWGAQGVSSAAGWSLDLRYDTLNQNQLRSGTGTVSASDAANTINPTTGSPAEVEKYTNNHYLTATLDYNQGDTWGVSIVLPYINRSHSTLGVGSDGTTPVDGGGAYDSTTSGVGDVKVIGRYFGLTDGRNFGLQFGVKLPTGKTNQIASDGVTPVDPGLQRGTGTTDFILGAYYFDSLNQNWDYFTQVQFQAALNTSTINGGTYRPGNGVNLSGGLRYLGFETFTPQVQVNIRKVNADSGTAADTFATGGTLVYLTPGVVIPVNDKVSINANVQLPVYQKVNGIQLVPKSIFSIGVHLTF